MKMLRGAESKQPTFFEGLIYSTGLYMALGYLEPWNSSDSRGFSGYEPSGRRYGGAGTRSWKTIKQGAGRKVVSLSLRVTGKLLSSVLPSSA